MATGLIPLITYLEKVTNYFWDMTKILDDDHNHETLYPRYNKKKK